MGSLRLGVASGGEVVCWWLGGFIGVAFLVIGVLLLCPSLGQFLGFRRIIGDGRLFTLLGFVYFLFV